MILWGREDAWIPVAKGEMLRQMIQNSVLHVIPAAGHLVIEEQPQQLISYILSFLEP
jgi:pimeloyl-ACP methyl ester carboxylesterase